MGRNWKETTRETRNAWNEKSRGEVDACSKGDFQTGIGSVVKIFANFTEKASRGQFEDAAYFTHKRNATSQFKGNRPEVILSRRRGIECTGGKAALV